MTDFREWRDALPGDFAVIGDPIGHSLSPRMHQAAFAELGLPSTYRAIRAPTGEVAAALTRLAELGYRGVNVTVPHKEEARRAMREVDAFADLVGAVNTVRLPELAGIDTDGDGFLDTLVPFEFPQGARALVLGAGGSARAVVASLDRAGFGIAIFNRTPERAVRLRSDLGVSAELLAEPDPAGASLIVNTTSAGLDGVDLPVPWDRAPVDAVAYDLVYGRPTPFLVAAGTRGLRVVDGLLLLVAQGARSLEWWLGIEAPRGAMHASLR